MTAKPAKQRLDQLLVDRGLVETRSQAQGLILAGQVLSENRVLDKPGLQVKGDIPLTLKEQLRYVSRGGLKLEKAIDTFGIDPTGRVAMDVGASTGGFTDCLLQHGATHVYAIDVGTNQLDWRLRQDPRVTVREQTHILKVMAEELSPRPSLVVIDVAFIGLMKVLPHITTLLETHTDSANTIIALIKPQFEFEAYCGKHSGFKGVVTQRAHVQNILQGVLADIASQLSEWHIVGLIESPILGPKGNHEYLLWLSSQPSESACEVDAWVEAVLTPCV